MTHAANSTMASSEAADTSFKKVVNPSKSKRLKVMPVQKTAVERTHSFTIRVYFPPPPAKQKFLPIPSMRSFFIELLKAEPSIAVVNPTNKQQLVLAHDKIPTTEADFKQFFTVSMDTRANTKQNHIIVGCHILSKRTIHEIKLDSKQKPFMEWLKQKKVFIESDTLGVNKTVSIGYLARLHPQYTHKANLKELLYIALEDVHLDPSLATELDPTLKPAQTAATTNGDVFVPSPPPFELYKTKITHGRDKEKVSTDIIGIKCAADKGRLLKEFFTQLASPEQYEKQIGFFIPTGAVHTLGAQNYSKLISENKAFVNSVMAIPIGDFQHATLDIPFSTDTNTDIEQTTLIDVINDQPWCLNVERTSVANKIMVMTTQEHLETARKWIDYTLVTIYENNIEDKLDVTTLKRKLFPRRLDKPIQTAASQAYTANLCRRASYAAVTTNGKTPTTTTNPQKKASKVDVSFAETEFPSLPQQATKNSTNTTKANNSTADATPSTPANTAPPPYDYKAELDRLSQEIETKLKPQLERLFAQLDQKIDSLVKDREEQEKVNENVSKQLKFLVDSVLKLLKTPAYQMSTPTQSPRSGDGHL